MGVLTGRAAIITGAGTGIGAAIATRLSEAGAGVVLVGRRVAPLRTVEEELRSSVGGVLVVSADVRDYAQVDQVASETLERFGRIDILVASAGAIDQGSVAEGDPSVWREVLLTNVLGVMHGVRAVLPEMLGRGSGDIVVVASDSGRETYPGEAAYVASKHAVIAFAECLRHEVARAGIRVMVVEPGVTTTPMVQTSPFTSSAFPGVTPLEPRDVALAVRFALEQPANVSVNDILVRPTGQTTAGPPPA